MSSLALLWALLQVPSPTSELVQLPFDISGYARGAEAVPVEPAGPGRLDGFELHLRDHGTPNLAGMGALGAYAALPIGPVSVYGGYEWSNLPDPLGERLTLGAAVELAPMLRMGLSYRALWPTVRLGFGNVLDFGFLVEPASWFSMSLGVDALNAPTFDDGSTLHRALRLGLAFRPWFGDPALTLAVDSRMIVTDEAQATSTRALADISAWEGAHIWGAYEHKPHENAFWVGLSFALMGAEVHGTSRVDNEDNSFWDRSGVALTVRRNPAESMVHMHNRVVEVPLIGDLHRGGDGLFDAGKVIPTAVLELDALSRDPTVHTVLLPVINLHVGMATVDELRAAIHRLREAGKEVIASLQGGDSKTYLVAAAASKVRLDPVTTLNLHGFSVSSHYLATTLGKVGVRFDAVGVGKYKSGPDPLTRDSARPEDREVEAEILELAYKTLVEALQMDRKLSPEKVHTILEAGLVDGPQALSWGLVDELYPAAGDPNRVPPHVRHGMDFSETERPYPYWSRPPVVAVVPIVGAIAPSRADNPFPGLTAEARGIVPQIDAAGEDGGVRALVVRIDSPGGDVFASEQIWRAIKRAAAKKPVIVSMGDVAASGGYYAAVAGHTILAQPNTITGSIGIFLVKPDISVLLEKIGVHRENYSAGEHADWESIEHGMSDSDKARLQHTLENYYGVFVGRVGAGRHMSTDAVRKIAEGRVYTGAHAKELGLVDGIGGLDDAILLACERAGIDRHHVQVTIPEHILSMPELVRRVVGISAQTPLESVESELMSKVRAADGRALAIMPEAYFVGEP